MARTAGSSLICSPVGEGAALLDAGRGELSLDIQRRIWALSGLMDELDGVGETVPGMNNLLVIFDPFVTDYDAVVRAANAHWPPAGLREGAGRTVEIPVVYGGRYGEDLHWMATRAGMSVRQFAELHAAGRYTVYALGGQPGFPFLGGLDPRLATPRRDVPRVHVAAGTVMIGGSQTGIYPADAPSGWNLIGHTTMTLFDPDQMPPSLLAPGDTVRMILEDVVP